MARDSVESGADEMALVKYVPKAEIEYPPFATVLVIMVALYLALFFVSLDRTIIATAIPRMTDTFHSLDDIGWYGSAYMITGCAFQLLYGRIYTFYSPKWVFLSAIGLFELGSLICGAAPSSAVFIIGRAIAGLGSCGIFSGTIMITVYIIPLRKRPVYQSFSGLTFGVASVVGPLLGGVFTDNATWRWCFYINLPIGFLTCLIIMLFLKLPVTAKKTPSIREQVEKLDPIGTLCFLPAIVCLLLALEWGGSTYAWNDGHIVALFIIFGLLMIAFVGVQIWRQETATVPPRIFMYRSVWASAFYAFCISGSAMVIIFYLQVWFQAIQGVDAVESGIRSLPLILALVVSSILAGGLVTAIGYFTPLMIASSAIMSVACGLLSTWTVGSSELVWISYQAIFGFANGLGQQPAGLAAQVVLPKEDVPTGISLKFFGQTLGGAIFVSVAQSVLSNKLISNLANLPNLNASIIAHTGVTELRTIVAPEYLGDVLVAYNSALTDVFKVAMAISVISLVGALLTEWKSVKGLKGSKGM